MKRLTLEAQERPLRAEVRQSKQEADKLRDDRSRSRALNAPMEYEYEERIEYEIYRYRGEHYRHRLARVARGTNHIVHTEVEVLGDISEQDYAHKLSGILQGLGRRLTSAEQHQNLVEEGEHKHHYRKADNDVE